MQIGIMGRIFVCPTLEEELDALANHGIECIQFGLSSVGLSDMPDHIDDGLCDRIRTEMDVRKIGMAALCGTYNIIHPDLQQREEGLRGLRVLASACDRLGTSVITLCTGTRSPESMWKRHPDNDTPEAWTDLIASMRQAVQIAEEYSVTLAFEPEVSNVADSAIKSRRLIDEIGSPYLKVCMDGANIFHAGELRRMREILDEAFTLLSQDIAMAHAKDLDHDGDAGHLAAGTGLLDYDQYLSLLSNLDCDVPLILHELDEAQVGDCVAFLRGKMEAISQ